jgi:hypothetical protein
MHLVGLYLLKHLASGCENMPVTREFAALLAQVVPVFAIALALEIRSLGPRLVEISKQEKAKRAAQESWLDGPFLTKASVFEITYMLSCATMPALGALEIRALHVASEGSKSAPLDVIFGAIAIVCIIPVVQGGLYFAEAWDARGKSWNETVFWGGPFLAFVMIAGLMVTGVFL